MELFSTSLIVWTLIAIGLSILGYFEIRKRNIK
jgi:hypothetical protein